MVRFLFAAVVALSVCLPLESQADEVLESIEQAVTLDKQGDYSGAAGHLE